MIPTPAAPLFEAAIPDGQEGRPSQPARSPRNSVTVRRASVSADKAAGILISTLPAPDRDAATAAPLIVLSPVRPAARELFSQE